MTSTPSRSDAAPSLREHLFLQPRGTAEWPDGTLATRYGFRHALHQQVLYECVPPGRRARIHQRIGDRLETGLGPRARESAAELAMHFARGHDARRAAQYHHHAGENALRRGAHGEAVAHLEQGLTQLASLPDGLERVRLELALQHTLGVTLMATKGYAAPEVVAAYGRARELCQEAGETSLLFSVLVGLWRFYFTQGALATTRELSAELLRMAEDAGDPALLLEARTAQAMVSFYLGELVTARDSAAQGIGIYDVREHGTHALVYGQDPGTNCLSYAAWSLLLLGYPDSHDGRVTRCSPFPRPSPTRSRGPGPWSCPRSSTTSGANRTRCGSGSKRRWRWPPRRASPTG